MMNRSDSHTSAVSVLAAETRSAPVSGPAGASTRNQQMMKSRSAAIAAVLVTAAALLWSASHYFGIGIPAGILTASRWLAIFGLAVCTKERHSLTTWILFSMIAGAEIGHDWPTAAQNARTLSLIFLSLIKTIIAPLLFSTLVVAGHSNLKCPRTTVQRRIRYRDCRDAGHQHRRHGRPHYDFPDRVSARQGLNPPHIADSAGGVKFDSIRNLVTRVLSPMIDNHFRHSAQHYEALDFLEHRSDRQEDAISHIAAALRDYGVQSVGTFISKISLPPQLMEILANRKLAEEEQKTYEKQKDKERVRKELAYLQHLSDSQRDIVTHEQQVKIADLERQAKQIVAEAEAASIRTVGEAELEVMRANMEALGAEKYLELEKLKYLATVKLPETLVSGAIGLDSPLDAIVLQMLRRFTGMQQPGNPPGGSPERAATNRDGK